jgi:hypothetical protein
MIGRDFVRDSTTPGRALLQFDNYFTWLDDGGATILRPGGAPLAAKYDPATSHLELLGKAPDQAVVDQAMAHVLLPSMLYREQRYRLTK